jgi:hypothetical protein
MFERLAEAAEPLRQPTPATSPGLTGQNIPS